MKTTIFIPLSGRHRLWPVMNTFLQNLDIDKATTELILLDTSQDKSFTSTVHECLADLPFADVRFLSRSFQQFAGIADQPRNTCFAVVNKIMLQIYTIAKLQACGDELFIVEDDVIPPENAYRQLRQSLQPDVFSVSGVYRVRDYEYWTIWRDLNQKLITQAGTGIEQVQATGFGCLLTRTADFRATPLIWAPRPTIDPNWPWGYDMEFFSRVEGKILVDWGVQCQHLNA